MSEPPQDLTSFVHDLRTPLTIIQGFAELLQTKGESLTPEQRADYLSRIAVAAQDMKEILDDERASRQAE
jgi:signal transduction histidine kinase